MENTIKMPFGVIRSLAASGKVKLGTFNCDGARTVTITCKGTTNGSATSGIRINLYFSVDGENYDTVAYAILDVDLTAGSATQETLILDAPEEGYMQVEAENLDSSYAATDIKVWITIRRWCD